MADRPFKPKIFEQTGMSVASGANSDSNPIDCADYRWLALQVTCDRSYDVTLLGAWDTDETHGRITDPTATYQWTGLGANATEGNVFVIRVHAFRSIKVRVKNNDGVLAATVNIYGFAGY